MRMSWSVPMLLALAGTAAMAANSTVVAVNMPAWLERDGSIKPLAPGVVLQQSDVIRTGAGARALIKLPEGSEVKLGEDAEFRLDKLGTSDGRKSPFSAALNVLKGAFRFTTGLFAKSREREVDVHIATVTAGIRGTDIWGKSDDEKDLVCLLEGHISVQHQGEEGFSTMDQPLDFYVAPKGKPALPIAKVDGDKVKQEWAPQTEPRAGQGLARAEGRWKLTVASVDKQDEALAWYDKLREAGYDAHIRPAGKDKFQVRIDALASRGDAEALGAQLKTQLEVPEAKVSR
jgi:hypothetical protein